MTWKGLKKILRMRVVAVPVATTAVLVLSLLIANFVFPFPIHQLERPPAIVVEDRQGEALRFFLPEDDRWRFPLSLESIPEELQQVVVAAEDRWFYYHPGVNPLAALRALGQNLRAGRVVSGASTLTMQVARMADPSPRTLQSKLRESFRALQLELHYSKREILEIYLNLAPYGGNLEGVGAAAHFYFGKVPQQLSLGENALLVTLPRSPNLYDPTRNPAEAEAARNRVLEQLGRRSILTSDQVSEARRQPLPKQRRFAPFRAPHFARYATSLRPGEIRLKTTVDAQIQTAAEGQVRRHLKDLRLQGVTNGAVVVVENDSRSLRALVGSGGFGETAFSGQVNGALARRSPGSTLKPYLYALALDEGSILPESWLLDIPTDFSGYVAENYDGDYRGQVAVREALTRSLNAPAVRLLARVGLTRFFEVLQQGGLSTLDRPAGSYGLPLVLGAAEVTLLELTQLYAALANGGTYQDLNLWEDSAEKVSKGPSRTTKQLFRPEAAWMVTEMLMEVERPDLPQAWSLAQGVPGVAWKTGTSYGHRDAWAVGYSRRYTVGVWVGNFDGSPRQGISGSEHAAPLLFDLLRSLEPAGTRPKKPRGLRLGEIEICTASRQRPGPFCPVRRKVAHIERRSQIPVCGFHRRAPADAETGELLTGQCSREHRRDWRHFETYPAELVAWWRAQGRAVPEAPRFAPDCSGAPSEEGPKIVSPDSRTPYHLRNHVPLRDQQLPLVARAEPGIHRLYWYLDGLLVAAAGPDEKVFLAPTPGEHLLVVTDDLGRSDSIKYRVE